MAETGKWIKGCDTSACVEVFFGENGLVSISATEDFNIVNVTKDEWDTFVQGVKTGTFD